MQINNDVKNKKLDFLCSLVKELVNVGKYDYAFQMIYEAMAKFPNNPEPHNLLGILLEMEGKHILAMKHFRIAWILDPNYLPANQNISNFSEFHPYMKYVYSDDDCVISKKSKDSCLMINI